MKLTELKTLDDMLSIYPLVKQLNPGMSKPVFTKRLKEMRKNGYRCLVAIDGRKLVGVAGFWVNTRFWCGTYIEPDNVVVDKSCRNKGVGKKLMDWLTAKAKKEGCDMVWALSYSHNHASHRFYYRERYHIKGYVFAKEMA